MTPVSRSRRRLPVLVVAVLALVAGALVTAGPASAAPTLLSQGKPATASSSENGAATAAGLAVDGDAGTRWSSAFSDPQWLQVDLGSTQAISQIRLNWEAAYASAFTIQTSNNGTSWTNITPTTAGVAGLQTLDVTGNGRYVRMNGTARATPYGFSLWEFQVYGGTGTDPQLPTSDTPDFGANVKIFDPSTPTATIQSAFDTAFNNQLLSPTAQFGQQRHAFLFKPGTYGRVWANLGFYTSVAGLGQNPDDVTINGAVNVDSGWNYGDVANATQNFWRSLENLSIVPEGGTNRWAVSQAAPMRRVHIKGNLTLAPSNQDNGQGYSSGGYLADSKVDGRISSGSQQQWYTRDSAIGGWDGGVWNMVYSGVQGAPPNAFPSPPHTTLASTPVTREKPYLYIDSAGKYRVFVPSLKRNSAGASWPNTAGSSIPMREFYVAKPSDSAARINQALAQGLNLFFTPGTYTLNETIKVTRANTVVTGIGYPTLIPSGGVTALSVADVDGVKVSGLTFDAGTTNSPTLMTVGTAGAHTDHAANPTSIQDVFFRIGSSVQGKATTTLVVHSDDTIIDHIWAWRADHGGAPTGWGVNTGDTGLVVNGDDVLATGLFVEHYQKYEVIWNGNRGRTIFFQNEKPYDVPNQAAWMNGSQNGYAAYKVADNVTDHEVWGAGSYVFFNVNPAVKLDHAFEVPNRAGVRLRSILTVSLGDVGTISNVVNNTGGAVPNPAGNTVPRNVVSYP
ncbi:discoidin domain-containing protein [Kineosporia babensis]|uniref:Discoidin domain-containing protein n=1 Tax=Kineosporia babensis TaxID=499548 RepID=A0A9X1NCZ9_9ACTN|nr:discoidin domain-containing protein [Kineosporia babensis]MCD5310758.1 discoidin domain-containing protein [Kineosporia babensis]